MLLDGRLYNTYNQLELGGKRKVVPDVLYSHIERLLYTIV